MTPKNYVDVPMPCYCELRFMMDPNWQWDPCACMGSPELSDRYGNIGRLVFVIDPKAGKVDPT